MPDRDQQRTLPGFEAEDTSRDSGQAVAPAPAVAPASAVPPQAYAVAGPAPESLQGQTVWAIDAHSLIYQVFHALPEMTSPRGEPVGAVFGFTRDLLYLLEEKKPDFLFCAFDAPGKTFRHDLYDQYKAGRPEVPLDLVPQIATIHRITEALGIPVLMQASYEADDILATIARIVDELEGHCFLVTGDKDCRQLITDRVKVYNIRKNEVFDRDAVAKQWGITPAQVVDFQALVGDSVDNVPGVPLIGPKAASELLQKYGNLESVLEHAAEVGGAKRRENLQKYGPQALLSRRLTRLDSSVPVAIDWQAARLKIADPGKALDLFRELGFRGLGERLSVLSAAAPCEPASSPIAPTYHVVDTPEALAALAAELGRQRRIAIDTETTSIWPRWAEIVGMSFSWNDHEAWYLPIRAPQGERHLELGPTLEALRPVLEDPSIEKVGQNLKYDMIVLRSAGVELAGLAFDTMVASYLLDAGERNHNLNDLAKRYLQHATIKISELIGSGKNQKRMDEVPVRRVADYAAEDALLPLRLRPILDRRLTEANLQNLFRDLELPLIDVLVDMEYAGVKLDLERLAQLSRQYGQRMAELEEEIYALAGRRLNIASPRQLQQVLFEELKLPVRKRTPKTGPSTDADVLEELAPLHALPAKILQYRQYAKLKGTYVDALPQMVHPQTGRVHASFNQSVAATGRLSSSDPNLQNIPVRAEQGREIRSAFIPGEPGWVLLAADYSQIELRILAHYSGDERLREAFARDEDIHARVASQVHGVPLEQVTPDMRRQAKTVNFGVIYGQSPFGLARELGIPKEQAAEFIDNYFRQYPGIEGFLVRVLEECRQKCYVSTILGRRRAVSGVRENAGRQRNLAERTAVNTVIQGSAADLIKVAMVTVRRRLREEGFAARMLLQIHDELVFEAPPGELDRLGRLVREEMSGAAALSVPLKVDLKAGTNWADAKRLPA